MFKKKRWRYWHAFKSRSSSFLSSLVLKEIWDRCRLAGAVLCERQSFRLFLFRRKSLVYHTADFDVHPLWWHIWHKVYAWRFQVRFRTLLLLLGHCCSMRWESEYKTTFDPFYGTSEKVFIHWQECDRPSQTWRHVLKNFWATLASGASKMSKLLPEELRPHLWTYSVLDYCWIVGPRHRLR